MSLPNRISKRLLVGIGLSLMAVSLTACFKPMLAERGGLQTTGVTGNQGDIYIEEIRTRVGQKVRNQLIYHFSGVNQSEAAPYRLSISIDDSLEGGLVQPSTSTLAETVRLNAQYTLVDTSTGNVVHGGSSFARATYDKGAALYANERARRDAEDRAAIELAEDIRVRIAAYFASR